MITKIMKKVLPILFCSVIIIASLYGQDIKITTRLMTESEFTRIKGHMGVFDYNFRFNGYGTGLKPPTEEEWERLKDQSIWVERIDFSRGITDAPVSFDNSATVWFPPIGNQYGENSCVAWSTVYYMKTFQEAKEHNWDLSGCVWEGGYPGYPSIAFQDKIFSPDFTYHQINDGLDNGSSPSGNMGILESIGACTWDKMPNYPNDFTTWPNEDAWRQAPWYRSQTSVLTMYVDNDQKIEELKLFLANGNLVCIPLGAYSYQNMTTNDVITLDNFSWINGHANTVVGYDDNYGPFLESGNPNTYGAFKVANSWGVGGWENVPDGFVYISYECMKQNINYAYFYQNYINYEPKLIAIFNIDHDLRGENKVYCGIGDPANPLAIKQFGHPNRHGGDHPYPTNSMVLDITEYRSYLNSSWQLFMQVYDGGSTTTGIINSFSIENYDDYENGMPINNFNYNGAAINTQHMNDVFLNIYTLSISGFIKLPDTTPLNNVLLLGNTKDQYQDGITYSVSLNNTFNRWQTFMPSKQNISVIRIFIQKTGDPGDILLSISDDNEQTIWSGEIKQDQAVNNWNKIIINPPLSVVIDDTYKMNISTALPYTTSNNYRWYGNEYSSYIRGITDWEEVWPGFDYSFQIYTNDHAITTNSSGYYESKTYHGWKGILIPTHPNGWIFEPNSRDYLPLISHKINQDFLAFRELYLNVKVFLEGPFNGNGAMTTTLNASNFIPLNSNEAYSTTVYGYTASDVESIPNSDVVDWVLLELRTGLESTTMISRRAAFIKSDGSVVDLDGISQVKFENLINNNCYAVIYHRNHLAVISANPISLSSTSSQLYDFSTSQTQAYGTEPMKDLGGGVFGMYTGDGNGDGLVTSTDFNVFNPKFTSAASGYEYSDWNLDGFVTSTDFNLFNPNFISAKKTYVP